jgi:predicted ATPase
LIKGVPDASQAASHIGQLIGLKEMQGPAKEKFWAVGKLFESLVSERPVVVAFDDIHWAGATFLELVKDVVLLVADAPVLILCLARTEILEHHRSWLEEDASTASVLLAPLSDDECTRLVEYVLGKGNPSSEAQAQIVRSAQGNPLFLQETLAMLIDDGLLVDDDGRYVLKIDPSHIQVPPTIHALLAARLDRLGHEERAVMQSASVVGDLFYRSEVAHLLGAGSKAAIDEHLSALIGKELVRSERSRFPDDPAYRFHHTLVREVAYDALATDSRAALHEAFARHLEDSARGWSRSYQELVGYHYERAHLYRKGLGLDDERTRALAGRAVEHLAAAGRKAHAGKDMPAAVRLLGRALAMLAAEDLIRVELLPVLADALADVGDYGRAHQVATEAIEEARRTGRRGIESYALTVLLKLPRQPGFRLSLGYGIASETGFRARD